MSRYATLIEIAGVSFTGCRGFLINGEVFEDPTKRTLKWAMDSTLHERIHNTQFKGVQFGISLGTEESTVAVSLVKDANQAIRNIRATQDWFRVRITDAMYSVDVKAVQDTSNEKWFSYGKFSGDRVYDVEYRFAVKSLF